MQPPNPSIFPQCAAQKRSPDCPSKSQPYSPAPTPPPSAQEGGEGCITHLFLPVAMETSPSPFIPSGTGNISPTQTEWRGLSPNTPVAVLGERVVVKKYSAEGLAASTPAAERGRGTKTKVSRGSSPSLCQRLAARRWRAHCWAGGGCGPGETGRSSGVGRWGPGS